MSRTASEKRFRTELQNSAQDAGFHVVPIPDMPRTRGTRFSVARVYDLMLVDEAGCAHGIEVKQVRSGFGWSFSDLSEDQEANVLDAARVGCGWLVIHHVARLSNKQARLRRCENLDRAWVIPISVALFARDRDGFNTLDPDWCDANAIRLMERGHFFWDDFLEHASQVVAERLVGA